MQFFKPSRRLSLSSSVSGTESFDTVIDLKDRSLPDMATLALIDGGRSDIFNSMYGGYTGVPSLPPPIASTATFWDEQKIVETCTPEFIKQSVVEPELKAKLDRVPECAEGLTESTYIDWIIDRAKKMFLVLVELGCPQKIFDVVDESWDDDDLPMDMDSIAKMGLDGKDLAKRFNKKQYMFLVRDLHQGDHIDYDEVETLPLRVISNRQPAPWTHPSIERVYYPRVRDVYYSRKKVPLGDDPHQLPTAIFQNEVQLMKNLSHPHIVSLYASYTHNNAGYLLLYPSLDLNLRSFIQSPPATFKSMRKDSRRSTILNWLHCLADAYAFMYEEGIYHQNVKPSSIVVDPKTNQIFFADIGNAKRLTPFSRDKTDDQKDLEGYDYGAPELWKRTATKHASHLQRDVVFSGRSWQRSRQVKTLTPTLPSTSEIPNSPPPPTPTPTPTQTSPSVHVSQWSPSLRTEPCKADIFSLGCIFLDLLSLFAKRKHSAFVTHRGAKNRRPRESAPPDSSFHANPGQIDQWISSLEKQSYKKLNDGAMASALLLVRDMLNHDPDLRPSPRIVADRVYRMVRAGCAPALPHCGIHTVVKAEMGLFGGWDGGPGGFGSEAGMTDSGVGLDYDRGGGGGISRRSSAATAASRGTVFSATSARSAGTTRSNSTRTTNSSVGSKFWGIGI